ncbi:O-antigen ligase family protein [Sinomonas atrocyanea]|uniref:O-antigen ligase family protein n=1 Tax=Sinomonas atrocyanea TaxID=37927 RepID=UPI003D9588C2
MKQTRTKAPLLKVTLAAILIVPPTLVLPPLGASGSLPQILALGVFALWLASAVLGLHDPIPYRHPGRAAVMALMFASCLSYGNLFLGLSGASTVEGRAAADRWILLMLAVVGIAFVTTESVHRLEDALSLTRWVLAGGSFCAIIAIIQFTTRINPVEWFPAVLPGFSENGAASSFQVRDALMRVAGTTLHPIELGVVTAMLLPLAVWRAINDPLGRRWTHWLTVALLLMANALAVSRSALLAIAVALMVMVPALPPLARRWTTVVIPGALAAFFVAVPGLVSTLATSVAEGGDDSSIQWRLDDYPLAENLVGSHPWFGSGPGTYLPLDAKDNFDNQYLLTAVTLGIVGLVAFAAYTVVPALSALGVMWTSKDPSLRLLASSAAAGSLIAAVASATFDSMSFPVFALIFPFFIGLGGAARRMQGNGPPGIERNLQLPQHVHRHPIAT